MKKEYIEKIPAHEIRHKLIICDNPECEKVVVDNGEVLEGYFQTGDEKKLIDCCSEKCEKKILNKRKSKNY